MKRSIIIGCLLFLFMVSPAYAYTNKQEQWFKMMEDVYVDAGMGIDQDDVMGAQCVDLASNYASYIFPINKHKYDYKQTLNFGDGKDLYDNAYSKYFDKIPYAKGVIPKRGDIVVWGGPTTLWGHVGVVADADASAMTVIHQNAGLKYGVIKTREGYGYKSFSGTVVGYLRPRDEMIKKLNPGSDGQPFYNLETKVLSRGSDLLRPEEIKKQERARYTAGYNASVDLGLMSEADGNHPGLAFTRLQGVILALRVMGLEQEAKSLKAEEAASGLHSMADIGNIPNWGKNYVALALDKGIMKGITVRGGAPSFMPDRALTGRAFTTILMRAAGYENSSYESIREDFAALLESDDGVLVYVNDEPLNRDRAGAILFAFVKNLSHQAYSKPIYQFLIDEGLIDANVFKELAF